MKKLKEKILNAVKYTGTIRKKYGRISVSEISSKTLYQMRLARDKADELATILESEELIITQATLGSIFDVGMRALAKELGCVGGERTEVKVPDMKEEWILSGEDDLINHTDKLIYDVKLTKVFSLDKTSKEKLDSSYWKQINMYRTIYNLEDYDGVVLFFLKDHDPRNGLHPKEALIEQPISRMTADEVWEMVRNVIKKIKRATLCTQEERWFNDTKCNYYCDMVTVCPYAKKRGYGSNELPKIRQKKSKFMEHSKKLKPKVKKRVKSDWGLRAKTSKEPTDDWG